MKNCLLRSFQALLVFSLAFTLTNCGNLDNPLEELSGSGNSGGGSDETPTVEDIIKYGFKVTDITGDVNLTEAVTSLKMSTDDGPVATAEVSNGKITIEAEKLSGITTAIDFWFEAEIGGKPYIAKVNIDPTTLSPESDKTLEMATLGDVILADGKFAAAEATGAVAKICYLGSETAEAANGFNHGLALAMSDANSGNACQWKTSNTDAGHTKQNNSTFTEESGLQYNSFTPDHNTSNYPAFKAAITYSPAAPTGCSAWFLASGYQWNQMLGANGYGLANLKTPANGYTGLQGDGRYWSSTEGSIPRAWHFSSYDGSWDFDDGKDDERQVRSCLAF